MSKTEQIREDLLMGRARIGVWGAGFIGGTTAMAFAGEGVDVTCYDISQDKVMDIGNGRLGVANLELWFGATMKEFVDRNLIRGTSDWKDMQSADVVAHFIAVPMEKNGEPWLDAIKDVMEKIKQCAGRLVIIESTLTPGELDRMDTAGLRIAVAPRRDWFHSPEKNLKNLNRVFAGDNPETMALARAVLSIVCDHLEPASHIRMAELVKSLENSLLHVPAVYAMQLAHAYPDIDIREVLDLAATHWRIPHYYPSFGCGGYCVPLSSKYVLLGATHPEELSIVHEVLKTDASEPLFVARKIAAAAKGGRVAVMGIAYKGDLKVSQLSPAIPIASYLMNEAGLDVDIHDPYYTHDEARALIDDRIGWFEPDNGLSGYAAIALVTDHKAYQRMPTRHILDSLDSGATILDNYGVWKKYAARFREQTEKNISYLHVGCIGWGDDPGTSS